MEKRKQNDSKIHRICLYGVVIPDDFMDGSRVCNWFVRDYNDTRRIWQSQTKRLVMGYLSFPFPAVV